MNRFLPNNHSNPTTLTRTSTSPHVFLLGCLFAYRHTSPPTHCNCVQVVWCKCDTKPIISKYPSKRNIITITYRIAQIFVSISVRLTMTHSKNIIATFCSYKTSSERNQLRFPEICFKLDKK